MKITEAIQMADTTHVVYFLLSAYVETLDYCDPARCYIPDVVTRLPIAGMTDVSGRASTVRSLTDGCAQSESRPLIEEVAEVFGAALQRLEYLERSVHLIRSSLSD